MQEERRYTMKDSENDVRKKVARDHVEIEDYDDSDEPLSEIAWEHVPVDNATLLRWAFDDLTLGFPDEVPDAEAAVERGGAYQIIAYAIYERLRSVAQIAFEHAQDPEDI